VAIDGGGLFLLWRDAQNAADTAALQAAYDRCTTDDELTWQATGYEAADINGFDSSDDGDAIGSDFSTDNTVTVKETFISGTGYVHVIVQADKPAYFIQLVYRGPLRVEAEAMVYCSRAVDFSDLPGMVALGDCNCPSVEPYDYTSGGEKRVAYNGSHPTFIGGIHSNCDIDINAGGGGADFVDGVPSATNEVNDHDKGNYETGASAQEAQPHIPADPLGLNIAMYAPGGAIFDNVALATAINADGIDADGIDDGVDLDFVDDGGSPYSLPNGAEGLYFVDGSASLQGLTSIGNKGLTVVATGQIEGIRARYVTWYYYGYKGETTTDFGVAQRFESGYWPAMLAFSTQPYGTCADPNSANSAIVPSKSADNNGDDDLDIIGVIYAPNGYISWSGNDTSGRGVMIGQSLDLSGAEFTWEVDRSMLPPRAPYMNNAQ
jgi:hypothetical protein